MAFFWNQAYRDRCRRYDYTPYGSTSYRGIQANAWFSRSSPQRFILNPGTPCVGVSPILWATIPDRNQKNRCIPPHPTRDIPLRIQNRFCSLRWQASSSQNQWRASGTGVGATASTGKNTVKESVPKIGSRNKTELVARWTLRNNVTLEQWLMISTTASSGLRRRFNPNATYYMVFNNIRREISWREFMVMQREASRQSLILSEGWQTYDNGFQSREITQTFTPCSKCKPITRSYTVWKAPSISLTQTQTTEALSINISAPGRQAPAPTSGFKAKTKFLTSPGQIINWNVSVDVLDRDFV